MKESVSYSRSSFSEKKVTGSTRPSIINSALAIMFCIVIIWLVVVPWLIFLFRGE